MTLLVVTFNLTLLAAAGLGFAALARRDRGRIGAVVVRGSAIPVLLVLALIAFFRPDFFGLLQLAAWVVFVHVPLYLLGAAFLVRGRSQVLAGASAVVALAVVATGVNAFLIEPGRLEVSHVTLESDRLEQPLRIGIVADLQAESPGEYERNALRLLMDARPDLILFPGDYLQVPWRVYGERATRLNAILREVGLEAPLGAVAVGGNTDPLGKWQQVFDDLPVTTLAERATLDLGPVRVTGLTLYESFDTGLRIPEGDKYHIVLGHAPDYGMGSVGADLLVAGHTHGGQVRLPWIGPLITFSRVPREWASGITRLDDRRTLVVSRGIGMERGQAPRLRFLCRPQLLIVDVVPAARNAP